MPNNNTSPTRMGKKDLIAALREEGFEEASLKDGDGNFLKRPMLITKLQEHRDGQEAISALSQVEENDEDIGVAIVQPDTNNKEDDTINQQSLDSPIIDSLEDINDDETNVIEETIDPSSPGWTQYVLGQFLEDEVDGTNPRVEGLRRVAGKLVGELVEEGCDLEAVPTQDNNFRACTKAWGVFITPNGLTKRFEALADASSDNCVEDFATYLVAMADTRAKGRMFRNALHLRRVVSAEEVSKTVATAKDIQSGGPIHEGQISMIRLIAGRLGVSIIKLLDSMAIPYKLDDNSGDVNLKTLQYTDAVLAAKRLSELRNSDCIPNDIKEGE